MGSMVNRYLAIILVFLFSGCGGEEGSSTHPPDTFGPYRVGFRYIEYYDAGRDRPAYTAVWYPGLRPRSVAEKVMYLSDFEGRAYLDA